MRFLNLFTDIPDGSATAFFKSWRSNVVICKTPAEAESVLLCFDRCGFHWKNGTPYAEAPTPPLTWTPPLTRTKKKKSLDQFLCDHFSVYNNICFSNNGTWGTLSDFPATRVIKVSDISIGLVSRMLGEALEEVLREE